MKTDIHPQYHETAKVQCACGNEFEAGSTESEIHVEVCAQCHPFYTGKQKLVDVAGRVDKFRQRQEESKEMQKKKQQKTSSTKKKDDESDKQDEVTKIN